MIKGKTIISAVLCAVTLTGCGGPSDLSGMSDLTREFRENLSYTFNDNFTVRETSKEDDRREWVLSFTDKNFKEHKVDLVSLKYRDSVKEQFDSRRKLLDSELFEMYEAAMNSIASEEMYDQIISKHLDIQKDTASFTDILYRNDDISIYWYFSAAETVDTDKGYERIKENISPTDGIKLCEEDMRSIASRDSVCLELVMSVKKDADYEPYIAVTEDIIRDYEEYVGDPLNYTFIVKGFNEGSEKSENVFKKELLFGNVRENEAELAEAEGRRYINIQQAVCDELFN